MKIIIIIIVACLFGCAHSTSLETMVEYLDPEFMQTDEPFQLTISRGGREEYFWFQIMYYRGQPKEVYY